MSKNGETMVETAVRFERLLPGPIERVWDHLSGDTLLAWLGGGTIERRVGGLVRVGEGGHIRGIVTQWKPPRLLSYTWHVFDPGADESPYPESYVTFELAPHGDQVLLTLTHRPMIERFTPQTLMGWHTLLDLLDAAVRGEPLPPRDAIMERHKARYGVTAIET